MCKVSCIRVFKMIHMHMLADVCTRPGMNPRESLMGFRVGGRDLGAQGGRETCSFLILSEFLLLCFN